MIVRWKRNIILSLLFTGYLSCLLYTFNIFKCSSALFVFYFAYFLVQLVISGFYDLIGALRKKTNKSDCGGIKCFKCGEEIDRNWFYEVDKKGRYTCFKCILDEYNI